MAPEQLVGEKVDARSDIYAAGVVLFEMATRQRPFPQESAPRLIDAIQHEAPPAPSAINRRLSPALDGIISKVSLLKIPSDRENAIQTDCDVFMGAPILTERSLRARYCGQTRRCPY